jgi:hypothetical protein
VPSLSLTVSLSQAPGQTYSQSVSNPQVLYQNPALLDHSVLATEVQHLPTQDRWRSWIGTESRRRLLAACLFWDGHAAIYQQQRRAQDSDAGAAAALQMIPLFGRSTKLWEASSAEEWANTVAADPSALQPEHAPPLEHLTPDNVARRLPIDRMIILSVLALRLPRRQRPLPATSLSANNSPAPEDPDHHMHQFGSQFSSDHHQQTPFRHHHHPQDPYTTTTTTNHNQPSPPFDAEERIATLFPTCPIAATYLALHHTPLRDLLAVGGDSWVFSQKILPATSFHEHQKRLKIWVGNTSTSSSSSSSSSGGGGMSVVRATVYAARAILGFLDRLPGGGGGYSHQSSSSQGGSGGGKDPASAWSADMSDYWAMYVCALICWAFGHPARSGGGGGNSGGDDGGRQSGSGGVGTPGGGGSASARSSPAPPQAYAQGHAAAAAAAAAGSSSSSRPGASSSAGDDEAAIAWLRMVAAEGVRLEDVVRVRGRREAAGVVGLVRRKLESDCVGGRSRLYVDAVGVLGKVEDGAGWKWF